MSKKVTAWQIIEEMSNRNEKVWLAPLSNVVSVNSYAKDGRVTIGLPLEMSNALLNNPRNNGGLLLIDSEQYDAMQKELEAKANEKHICKEFECELTTMLENIPQNRPLYKDSGSWQVRTDDMEEVIFEQGVEESFFDFIKRVYTKENSFMGAFND
jgi:hypothetical protein